MAKWRIKKTVCAFLKILHPDGPPGDEEFEEYVAYAVECRRRVKEQMNKRKSDVVEDPYIRMTHQIHSFVRLCEAVVKYSTVKHIQLITSYDEYTPLTEVQEKLDELKQSLFELDVVLEVEVNPNLHNREIRIDNGWVVKIGRGLDFYQKPDSWFEVGVNDLSLRKCLETRVDIFRQHSVSPLRRSA